MSMSLPAASAALELAAPLGAATAELKRPLRGLTATIFSSFQNESRSRVAFVSN